MSLHAGHVKKVFRRQKIIPKVTLERALCIHVYTSINCGVLQVPFFLSLFFVIYVNDVMIKQYKETDSKIILYADDTVILLCP